MKARSKIAKKFRENKAQKAFWRQNNNADDVGDFSD
jgi:hypothetical protein